MLSNAYFLAKFRFDTAENEPAKNLQQFAKFANFADPNPLLLVRRPRRRSVRKERLPRSDLLLAREVVVLHLVLAPRERVEVERHRLVLRPGCRFSPADCTMKTVVELRSLGK